VVLQVVDLRLLFPQLLAVVEADDRDERIRFSALVTG
jgi:hypothetical protein